MMTEQEISDVVLGFAAGKEVEYRYRGKSAGRWVATLGPCWNFAVYNYRLTEEPQQRPSSPLADEAFVGLVAILRRAVTVLEELSSDKGGE